MRNEPLTSVVTPVYNGGEFLEECIESVLAQTWSNWEYVLVDNCSTDNTADIIRKYAARDERITLISNREHLKVMDNLNNAFRFISQKSKYCKVVHADDWLFPSCITEMVAVAEKHPTIGVVSSYRLDHTKLGLSGLPYPINFIEGEKICRSFFLERTYFFGSPSTLLIRSDLIRKRKDVYDPEYLQSDIAACLDILAESDFGFVHQVLSFTRRHENTVSANHAKKMATSLMGYLKMFLKYGPVFLNEKEMQKYHPQIINFVYIELARNIMDSGFRKSYNWYASELKSMDLPLRHLKIARFLIREILSRSLHMTGFEVRKLENNRKSGIELY